MVRVRREVSGTLLVLVTLFTVVCVACGALAAIGFATYVISDGQLPRSSTATPSRSP